MKQARHVGKEAHNLTLIEPSEIVLHNIIGEGSFGRVWSAMWNSSQVAVKEFVFAQVTVGASAGRSGGSGHSNNIIGIGNGSSNGNGVHFPSVSNNHHASAAAAMVNLAGGGHNGMLASAAEASAAGAEMAALVGGVHGSSAGRVNLLQNRRDMVEEIVGEAGIMSYLRHPRILQLFGCSLTAQAIWIVSELCSQGSLRQVLDDKVRGGEGLE